MSNIATMGCTVRYAVGALMLVWAAKMSGQSFISLPGNAPPHAIQCGSASCLFYLRYSRPFDHKVYPMPEKLVRLK